MRQKIISISKIVATASTLLLSGWIDRIPPKSCCFGSEHKDCVRAINYPALASISKTMTKAFVGATKIEEKSYDRIIPYAAMIGWNAYTPYCHLESKDPHVDMLPIVAGQLSIIKTILSHVAEDNQTKSAKYNIYGEIICSIGEICSSWSKSSKAKYNGWSSSVGAIGSAMCIAPNFLYTFSDLYHKISGSEKSIFAEIFQDKLDNKKSFIRVFPLLISSIITSLGEKNEMVCKSNTANKALPIFMKTITVMGHAFASRSSDISTRTLIVFTSTLSWLLYRFNPKGDPNVSDHAASIINDLFKTIRSPNTDWNNWCSCLLSSLKAYKYLHVSYKNDPLLYARRKGDSSNEAKDMDKLISFLTGAAVCLS